MTASWSGITAAVADFCSAVLMHGLGVGMGHHPCRAGIMRGANRTGQIGTVRAPVGGEGRLPVADGRRFRAIPNRPRCCRKFTLTKPRKMLLPITKLHFAVENPARFCVEINTPSSRQRPHARVCRTTGFSATRRACASWTRPTSPFGHSGHPETTGACRDHWPPVRGSWCGPRWQARMWSGETAAAGGVILSQSPLITCGHRV